MADAKLRAIITVANKASQPLKKISSDMNRLRSPIRNLSRQFKALDRASGFKELRRGIGGVTRELTKFGLIGTGAAVAGFAALNKLSKSADELKNLSTNYDITTDAIQQWRFVAERSGVSVTSMNKSMQAFTKRMAEARNGTGELFGLLSKVNPAFLEQLLAVDNNTEAYALLIKTMTKLPDQQRQILLGDKAFSEAGRELVKITALGVEEIERLKKAAIAYGAVIDQKTLKQSVKFQESMTNFSFIARNIAYSLGAELIPAVTELMQEFSNWYQANKKIIAQNLAEYGKKAAAGIKQFVHWMKEAVPKLLEFIDRIGGFKTVAIGPALVIAGPLIAAMVSLGTSLVWVGVFLAGISATSLAIGALVAVAVAAAVMIATGFNPLATFFPQLWNDIVSSCNAAIDTMLASIETVINKIKAFASTVRDLFQFDTSGNGFNTSVTEIKNVVNSGIDLFSGTGIGDLLSGLFSNDSSGNSADNTNPQPAVGNSPSPSLQSAGGSAQVGGKIQLEIKSDAPVRVRKLESDNPRVPIDVYAGQSFGAAL